MKKILQARSKERGDKDLAFNGPEGGRNTYLGEWEKKRKACYWLKREKGPFGIVRKRGICRGGGGLARGGTGKETDAQKYRGSSPLCGRGGGGGQGHVLLREHGTPVRGETRPGENTSKKGKKIFNNSAEKSAHSFFGSWEGGG